MLTSLLLHDMMYLLRESLSKIKKKEIITMKTFEKIEELENMIEEVVSEEFYTPYKIASLLSSFVSSKVNPQMMYNYCKKNYIVYSLNEVNKMIVEKKEVKRFMTKYLTKKFFSVDDETGVETSTEV